MSVNLSKVTLTKGTSINLEKKANLGEIKVNLNWGLETSQPQVQEKPKGFFAKIFGDQSQSGARKADLDLGVLLELSDGYVDCIQPLGNYFGSFDKEPYIHLDGDDRTGAVSNGENLRINGTHLKDIKRVLIFALIYEGVANWSQIDGVVTIKQQDGPDLIVNLDEPQNGLAVCAVAMLTNDNNETFKVEKLERYFPSHMEMDKAYKFGLKWTRGAK